jgi:hypothetical protein
MRRGLENKGCKYNQPYLSSISMSVRLLCEQMLTFATITKTSSRPNQPLLLIVLDIRHVSKSVEMTVKVTVTHCKSRCSPGYALKIITDDHVVQNDDASNQSRKSDLSIQKLYKYTYSRS